MDACTDPETEIVVFMKSAQVGATELVNNVLAYFIVQDPSPILVLQPTLEMGEAWSKDRLAPMIRDTEALGAVFTARGRVAEITIRHKSFPGGHVTVAGANSPASLAMRPIRIVLADEVDRYPPSAGAEGDPLALAIKRSTTFWNRLILVTSTPTERGLSRIERWFAESSREYFEVPCYRCRKRQRLAWARVRWDKDGDTHHPETARYHCIKCEAAWGDTRIAEAVRKGRWKAEDRDQRRVRGFHVSELYSPWVPLAETAANFLAAQQHRETLRVWVNTALGESWEEAGETLAPDALQARTEHYDTIPREARWLIAGADCQIDRVEVELVAFSAEREAWSMDYRVIPGSPLVPFGQPGSPWNDLDEILTTEYQIEDGGVMGVHAAFIDANAFTKPVYAFTQPRELRRVFACRGQGGEGKPVIVSRTRDRLTKARVFTIGVDGIKAELYGSLQIEASKEGPTPGACHFPAEYPRAYFEQIVSERRVTRYHRGFPRREWELPANTRNEALDCRIYAMAALDLIAPRRRLLTSRSVPVRSERSEAMGFGPGRPFGDRPDDYFRRR